MTISGENIVKDYHTHHEVILAAINGNDFNTVYEINASLAQFLAEESNQKDVSLGSKAMQNIEDFFMNLPLELRRSCMKRLIGNDRKVTKILGPSEVLFSGMKGDLSTEGIVCCRSTSANPKLPVVVSLPVIEKIPEVSTGIIAAIRSFIKKFCTALFAETSVISLQREFPKTSRSSGTFNKKTTINIAYETHNF